MRPAALRTIIGGGVVLTLTAVAPASARVVEAEAALLPPSSVVQLADGTGAVLVTARRPVRLQLDTRPTRGVRLRVHARRCRRGGRLHVSSAPSSASFALRRGTRWRSLRWRAALPAGTRTVQLRFAGSRRCRVLVDRVELAEIVVLGTALDTRHFGDLRYAGAAAAFTGATPENAMKMEVLRPAEYRFAFDAADRIVEFARDRDQEVHGHPLVYGAQLPGWLVQTRRSRAQLRELMRGHISQVVGRYRGQVASWDVVNEAFESNGTLRRNFWLRGIGPDYIADAFRWAHEADPEARLYYNDTGIEHFNARSDAVLKLLTGLRDRGVPVHGVGMQAHLYVHDDLDVHAFAANVQRFADAGFEIAFSELDVALDGKDTGPARQTELYRQVAEVCAAQVRCRRVTVWGVSDAASWKPPHEAPLPIDADYRPKPAWCELVRLLQRRACG